MTCDECGKSMEIDETGVSHHINVEGEIDYDADLDHVAYSTEGHDAEDA